MDPTRLAPEPATGEKKQQAMQDARDMYNHTLRTCGKLKIAVPPYDFLELIGKGGSGRVYKCRDRKTGDLVAVKIVDTDTFDYRGDVLDKDNTISDYLKEVATLQKVKEGQVQNVNVIHDAFAIGANLWIVSDYCTGGSVRTLMRALPPGTLGLEENYIITVARELLVALVGLHSLGIIHRDIKCTNVYITETGALQLGDFGVVGVTDDHTDKRKTILGTPHWMPRELLTPVEGDQAFEGYGAEIDMWAFGCTLFEMATGNPPNARVAQHNLGRALLKAPRLEGEQHSQQLRDFVAYCLDADPQQRPTAQAALDHPYVANTQKRYPTGSLVKLIEKYKLWEYGGGIRQSLFMAGGAPDIPAQMEEVVPEEEDADDWNFSTSDSFDTDFQKRFSHMLSLGTQGYDFNLDMAASATPHEGIEEPSRWDKLQEEWASQRVDRAGESLARIYDTNASQYRLHTPMTDTDRKKEEADDLPLRSSTQDTDAQESVLDLDEAQYDPNAPFNFDFVDATTLKARKSRRMSTQDDDDEDYQYGQADNNADKRATMEWTFPSTSKKPSTSMKLPSPKRATMDWTFASARPTQPDEPDARMELPPPGDGEPPSMFRPTLKHTQTLPLGHAGDYIHAAQSFRPPTSPIRDSMASMIDLDMGTAPSSLKRDSMAAIIDVDSATRSLASTRDSVASMIDLDAGAPSLTSTRDSVASMIDLNMGMVDDSEIERPGTAVSTTGSHFSDMTSGNPFDLEEDPNQNELDRNRFSYHKQWQSEGGQVDRHSRRSIPMHTRGSSLSSTDNEIERRSNGLTYHIQPGTRPGKNSSIVVDDNIDLDSWPNFDQPGIERVSSHEPDVVHVRQPSATSAQLNGRQRSRMAVAFPAVVGPSAPALEETASPALLGAELERLCGGLGESLSALSRAFEQHAGLEEEEGVASGSESGFEPRSSEL